MLRILFQLDVGNVEINAWCMMERSFDAALHGKKQTCLKLFHIFPTDKSVSPMSRN